VIKDRALKATALQYLVSKRYFPQLEVVVMPQLSTGSASSRKGVPLTDVDVLGLAPDDFEAYRSVLIDCRTLRAQSPIGRALWMRGLMDELAATRGICVLRGQVESDHRIAASQLDVLLITESEFEKYIISTGGKHAGVPANSANIDLWDAFLAIPSRYRPLAEAIEFSTTHYWQPKTAAASCRKTLGLLRRLKGELDPAKADHAAVVANMTSLFLISVAEIVLTVFTSYLQPKAMAELSDALLIILYGGKETYDSLNALRRLVKVTNSELGDDLSLPDWERFVQFTRETLEAPIELTRAPLIMREIAWSLLSAKPDFSFAATLIAESPRAAKYALLGTEYLCRAARLPPEFSADLSNQILKLQKAPA
jgi:hypothetical protein